MTAGRRHQGRSLNVPLWSTSTWQTEGLDDTRKRATGMRQGEFYSRYANPTVRAFEDAIADLEGAEDALAFASGMGAIASTVLALCSAGDHIVVQRQIYAGTLAFVQGACARFGIEHTVVDGTEPGAFAAAVRPGRTMLVLAESPSNPASTSSTSTTSAPSAARSPLSTRRSPRRSASSRCATASTSSCTRRRRASPATTTPRSASSPASASCSTRSGPTACCTARPPSPHDALDGLRGIRTLAVRQRHQADVALRVAERAGRATPASRPCTTPACPTTRSTPSPTPS